MAYNYSKDKEALIRLRKCFTTPNAFYEDGIFFDENWDSKAYLEEGEEGSFISIEDEDEFNRVCDYIESLADEVDEK